MIMRFREFQESEAHNDRFRAKPYAQQRCSGVGVMLDSHLGGLHVLVVEVIEIVEVDHLCQILPFQQSRWRSACACIPFLFNRFANGVPVTSKLEAKITATSAITQHVFC